MNGEVKMIAIERIRILNPRFRDRTKFERIIQSIRNLGLKKPVQVSLRSSSEDEGPGYDLVCGQGRIEAFMALGHKEIPAIIVEISKEERLLRSLVENIARRHGTPLALIREIERLKVAGYSNTVIAGKLDISDTMVGGLITLKNSGEERLLEAAMRGRIPLGVAMEIAKTDTAEAQREFLKAYENKQLNQASIRAVKRLIEQRRFLGKHREPGKRNNLKTATSAEGFVNAYRRESQRQKLVVKKAKICDTKLTVIVSAFGKLMADIHLVNLLRSESLATMPKHLWEKINGNEQEAA